MKNSVEGFWFSFIETFTILFVIFLLLFIIASSRERTLNKQQERLVKSWQNAKDELANLNAAPEYDERMGGMRITLADKIVFALNSYNLHKEGKNRITEISKILVSFYKKNPELSKTIRIRVGGHTDKIGGDTVNFPLSYMRAYNVSAIIRKTFHSENIYDVDITPIAYGSKYPVPGLDNEIEPKNRRITIVLEFLSVELLKSLEKTH